MFYRYSVFHIYQVIYNNGINPKEIQFSSVRIQNVIVQMFKKIIVNFTLDLQFWSQRSTLFNKHFFDHFKTMLMFSNKKLACIKIEICQPTKSLRANIFRVFFHCLKMINLFFILELIWFDILHFIWLVFNPIFFT